MEFLKSLPSYINNSYIIGGAIFIILAKAVAMLSQAFDFHDKYFVKKRLDRLEKMRESSAPESQIAKYLDRAIEQEKFRISSRISTSPAKKNWLMQLEATNIWSHSQIQAIPKFLVTDLRTGNTSLVINKAEVFEAHLSLIAGLVMVVAGSGYLVAFFYSMKPTGLLVGGILFILFVFVSKLFSSDFFKYRSARKVEFYLAHNPLPTNPEPQ